MLSLLSAVPSLPSYLSLTHSLSPSSFLFTCAALDLSCPVFSPPFWASELLCHFCKASHFPHVSPRLPSVSHLAVGGRHCCSVTAGWPFLPGTSLTDSCPGSCSPSRTCSPNGEPPLEVPSWAEEDWAPLAGEVTAEGRGLTQPFCATWRGTVAALLQLPRPLSAAGMPRSPQTPALQDAKPHSGRASL